MPCLLSPCNIIIYQIINSYIDSIQALRLRHRKVYFIKCYIPIYTAEHSIIIYLYANININIVRESQDRKSESSRNI